MPLSPEVTKINPNGVSQLSKDVHFLTDFVSSLENSFMLEQNLDELQQTVALMESDNHDEFFDISTRNKKYGRVDAMNGPVLLEKYVPEPFIDGQCASRLTCDADLPARSKH